MKKNTNKIFIKLHGENILLRIKNIYFVNGILKKKNIFKHNIA